ncbi:MAG: hypothetical protein HY043_19010 [Verrucomicrobia bacterium]|nr:hypothetical protein [Verrucomicrobiota bacterium]
MQIRALFLVVIAITGLVVLIVANHSESSDKAIERHLRSWRKAEARESRLSGWPRKGIQVSFDEWLSRHAGFSFRDRARRDAERHIEALHRLGYLETQTFDCPRRIQNQADWDKFIDAALSLTNKPAFFSWVEGGGSFPSEVSITLPKQLVPQLRKLIEEWNSPMPATNSATP